MGEFVNMTALRGVGVAEAAEAILEFSNIHGMQAEIVDPDSEIDTSARFYPAPGSWMIVCWDGQVSFPLKVTRWLSTKFQTLASVVQIYDSDDWTYASFVSGRDGDRYSSDPSGHASDITSLAEAEDRWRGDAAATAEIFGCDAASISPYFLSPAALERRSGDRAFPDDGHVLGDPSVVTDFWRRLGIIFPQGADASKMIRFSGLSYPYPVYDITSD